MFKFGKKSVYFLVYSYQASVNLAQEKIQYLNFKCHTDRFVEQDVCILIISTRTYL